MLEVAFNLNLVFSLNLVELKGWPCLSLFQFRQKKTSNAEHCTFRFQQMHRHHHLHHHHESWWWEKECNPFPRHPILRNTLLESGKYITTTMTTKMTIIIINIGDEKGLLTQRVQILSQRSRLENPALPLPRTGSQVQFWISSDPRKYKKKV